MQITNDEYDTLYTNVEREMRIREMLGHSLRTTTAKEHIRQITREIVSRQNDSLWDAPTDGRIRTITHLAVRCNHNAARRMRSRRNKVQLGNSHHTVARAENGHENTVQDGSTPTGTVDISSRIATILVASTTKEDRILIRTRQLLHVHGDSLAGDKDISKLDYERFIRMLEKEVGFEGQCSGVFYYAETPDGWIRIRISTEARWHGALQDSITSKMHRATFVIEPLP
jgi:hypothetical protein